MIGGTIMYNKNAWEKYSDAELKDLMAFCEEYKEYITKGKTERLCVNEALALAKKAGYKDLKDAKDAKPGDLLYSVNKNKNIVLYKIGKKPVIEGIRILGAIFSAPDRLQRQSLTEMRGRGT